MYELVQKSEQLDTYFAYFTHIAVCFPNICLVQRLFSNI